MKSLFVGNMSFQTTEGDLRTLFEPFGQVTRVHMAMDRETGRARGFAFIEMPNDDEAAKAMAGLDGKELGGRNLKVNEARPKGEGGPPRSGQKSFKRRWRRARPLLERRLSRICPAAARTALVACTLHELMDTPGSGGCALCSEERE
jgi:RNA recognition motif-containing protein